ncbi:DUF397 domain-containing protein [Streptomyces griseosporeus]|uniref:DUF397 domain-containing protein n=1 Tax=Streptomyces griseosporeus TaxID=1910 RepID=UPI00167DC7BE|nr:DUF397 domain-containing protein [Streptomyces griseosporeus]GHF66950.1 hypothetical protein GCM10018783_40260 [Streptomyces griseosporeus]
MTAPATHRWFKSSYSGGSGTECVECAHVASGMLVRDSKSTSGVCIEVGPKAWRAFISALTSRDA